MTGFIAVRVSKMRVDSSPMETTPMEITAALPPQFDDDAFGPISDLRRD